MPFPDVDAKELEGLLIELLQREGIEFDRKVVTEFVNAEFAKADTDGSGSIDRNEYLVMHRKVNAPPKKAHSSTH